MIAALAYEWLLGTRYLRSTRGRGFLSFISLVSALGLAVGVAVLPLDPMFGLGATTVAGSVDAFLVDRVFKGASPKIFIERLADIASVS